LAYDYVSFWPRRVGINSLFYLIKCGVGVFRVAFSRDVSGFLLLKVFKLILQLFGKFRGFGVKKVGILKVRD
jgi:hypothetical protein